MVRANDWRVLQVPALGSWDPTLTVSVVIPAHDAVHLPKVLAGLAAQTYPPHLLEVVVVDDGSQTPVVLPDVRPSNTKLLRMLDGGWGRAATCQFGADHSDGEVIHWLDADMVAGRAEVEAQLRWHHVIDYAVVLGHKVFADVAALDHVTPATLRQRLAEGAPPELLVRGGTAPHEWIDKIMAKTDGLSTAGPRAMRVHTGASASVGRDLFRQAGGMPVDLILGEDIVLGYRLREAGAVFIPDREAHSLHLGQTQVTRSEDAVNRYNKPFITDKVPEFRGHRMAIPRSYEVPYVEIAIPVHAASYEAVRAAVDAQLAGTVPDLIVTLLADWSSLPEGRRQVLADPRLDLRLVRAAYSSEPRVRLAESVADTCEATFRLTLPDPHLFPVGTALEKMLVDVENQHVGSVEIALAPGLTARLDRSAAASRARWIDGCGPGEGMIRSAVYPARTLDRATAGFTSITDAPPIAQVRGLVPWGVRKSR